MALAVLCTNLRRNPLMSISCTALIIDHKAREGSTEEAERTRLRLQDTLGPKPKYLHQTTY